MPAAVCSDCRELPAECGDQCWGCYRSGRRFARMTRLERRRLWKQNFRRLLQLTRLGFMEGDDKELIEQRDALDRLSHELSSTLNGATR